MSTNARDELYEIIRENRAVWVTNTEHRDMERKQADAILADGYSKPRTITTVEELDALPVESIVRDDLGFTYDKWWDEDGSEYNWWATTGDRREYSSKKIALPATVLHEGQA